MIGFVFFHHRVGDPLGIVPTLEFLDGEGNVVVGAVMDSENLKLGTTLAGVDKDDSGHGRFPFLTVADSIICTAPAGPGFAFQDGKAINQPVSTPSRPLYSKKT